mmetsp:Transcript_78922/g.109347  ORF Transcript_78922/g.109347 Transcript_78922/m.109347 type:complete len:87 (+) Transcript_78922:232-492(+)
MSTNNRNQNENNILNKVYVGNINYNCTQEQIKAHFKLAGTVVNVVLPPAPNGGNKGFAFVEMGSPEQANEAIALNNSIHEGRKLTV